MRAVVHDRYGPPDVLRIEDVQRPVPADDELLVRVHATTVTQTDCHRRAARPFVWRFILGLRRPRRRTLGLEFAGVVDDVGSAVTQFAVGDRRRFDLAIDIAGTRSFRQLRHVLAPSASL